ncbi:hypothetical protein [Micromonospora sp. NPDC000442]|uniref:hypothetical protein n=1 Tax=Micromonospora sp. NPDC000442 TaxID=3364217 RepID=UPI00369A53F6
MAMAAGEGWRWWLSAGSAGLVVLPYWQGAPWPAVVAAVFGVIVVSAWAWGTRSGRGVGVVVGAGFIVVLATLFAVSQWPRGLPVAPWLDWFVMWLLVGAVCLAALIIDRIWHASMVEWNCLTVRWIASVVPLAGVVLLCGGGLGIAQIDGDGRFRVPVRVDEILPLPTSLRLVSADTCASGGSSGNCTAKFVVTANDGASRETTVTRLVAHLRARGWPLQPEHGSYSGSRDISGLLHWSPHRIWLYTEAEPATVLQPAAPQGTVNIYIDNL